MNTSRLRRTLSTYRTRLKMARIGLRAVADETHPILVHMIPIRRCNLACTYCNEYDDFSPPVPTDGPARSLGRPPVYRRSAS